MKVLRYETHNVLKVADISFDLEGHHLFLVGGKNDQGKSSAIKSLLMALCGRSGMEDFPDVALRQGEDDGWVKVDLAASEEDMDGKLAQGLAVELLLKRKRGGQVVESFRITDGEGNEVPQPRALLQRMYSLKAFDPLAFERLPKKEKRGLLQKLVGLDFSEQKKEYDRLYKEREAVNRDGKNVRARFDGMPVHADAPAEEVSVSALVAELERRRKHNDVNDGRKIELGKVQDTIDRQKACRDGLESKIAELQRQLANEKLALTASQERWKELAETVEAFEPLDEVAIRDQIGGAEALNNKARANAQREAVGVELEALRKQSQELSDKMAAIVGEQAAALMTAKWPVPGLSIDDDGVLYNGLPFEQAAKSKRILTSAKIGMALNPRLKLLVCEGGSDLDVDTIEALDQLLKEGGFQCIVELVTRGAEDEERCSVIIENGKAKKKGGAA